jgi:hypothetical protein
VESVEQRISIYKERYEVMPAGYFELLITKGEAERARLKRVLELLEPTDLLFESAKLFSQNLDSLIAEWRENAVKATRRLN